MMQSCSSTRQKVSWSDLPQPILQFIVKLLGNDLKSLLRFRSVCNKWRQSTAYSVPPSVNNNNEFSSSIILLRPLLYARGGSDYSSTPWMVFSVHIARGITLFFHPFSGIPLINLPQNLNLSQFDTSEFHIAYHKVYTITSEIVSLSPLFSPKRVVFRNEPTDKCDDIVQCLEFYYSVDRKGNLYISNEYKVLIPVCKPQDFNEVELHEMAYRKRLVAPSSLSEKLYLVARNKDMLRVYEHNMSGCFIQVQSFGYPDMVLFITRDYSFFVPSEQFPGCQLKDCIVFTYDAFPPYSGIDLEIPKDDGGGVYICKIGRKNHAFMPVSSYPGFPLHLCSPPS